MESTLVIVNPTSGDHRGQDAVRRWADQRPGVTVRCTQRAGDAKRFAEEGLAGGVLRIIAVGGDGTLHEVINALAGDLDAVELGVVPLGTGNDFARNTGISLDPQLALKDLESARVQRRDVLRITRSSSPDDSMLCLNAASAGFARVLHQTLTKNLKSRFGPFAYLIAAAKALIRIPWAKVKLTADGQPITRHCCAVLAAKGEFVAGGSDLAPTAQAQDGNLELIIVTAQNLWQRFCLAVRFYLGKHLSSNHVTYRRANHVHIDAKPSLEFMCDGEMSGKTPIDIEVLPGAIRVLVPSEPGPKGP